MYFIARSYRLTSTRYLVKQLDAARGRSERLMVILTMAVKRSRKDIALLTIKGMTISERYIRQTKQSTIKTQSSSIYKKAGVSSRAQLMDLLIEELLK